MPHAKPIPNTSPRNTIDTGLTSSQTMPPSSSGSSRVRASMAGRTAKRTPAPAAIQSKRIQTLMTNPAASIPVGLVGPDVEPAVDGEGVGGDDLPADGLRDFETEPAIPRRGRTDDEQEGFARIVDFAHRGRIRESE